jgi:macrolide transport system ATP-binding/permease protein
MTATDNRTVGQAVAEAIAEPLAALATLDAAALALADGTDRAQEQYAAALEHAEALDAWDAERRVQIALEALDAETDMTGLLADLSVGQRYRVRLACLLGADHDFLLLDEPTNHLDRSGLEFLDRAAPLAERRCRRRQPRSRAAVDIAETIVDLDPTPDDRPRVYGNGYAGYREGRAGRAGTLGTGVRPPTAEHARLQDSLSAAQNRLVSGWRPEKGTNKHGRATRAGGLVQSVHRRQEALEAHAVTVPEPPQLFRFPDLPTRTGAVSAQRRHVSVAGRFSTSVVLALAPWRLVVTGPNGAGKSTLLSVLGGELSAGYRERCVCPGARAWAFSVRRRVCRLIAERARCTQLTSARSSARRHFARVGGGRALSTWAPAPARGGQTIGELSMGQQRRLDLALVLATHPHVLLLDEPTNHLSIALVDELTDALGATASGGRPVNARPATPSRYRRLAPALSDAMVEGEVTGMSEKNLNRMRALRPLASRDYRLLFAAVGIEVFGTGMWTIVMVFQVLALDDSPLALSAVATGMSLGLFALLDPRWRCRRSVLQTPIIITVQGCTAAMMTESQSCPSPGRSNCGTSALPHSRWAQEARSSTPPTARIYPRCSRLSNSSPRTGSKAPSDPRWGRAWPALGGVVVGMFFPAIGAVIVAGSYAIAFVITLFLSHEGRS